MVYSPNSAHHICGQKIPFLLHTGHFSFVQTPQNGTIVLTELIQCHMVYSPNSTHHICGQKIPFLLHAGHFSFVQTPQNGAVVFTELIHTWCIIQTLHITYVDKKFLFFFMQGTFHLFKCHKMVQSFLLS
jgi:hypothetical protein